MAAPTEAELAVLALMSYFGFELQVYRRLGNFSLNLPQNVWQKYVKSMNGVQPVQRISLEFPRIRFLICSYAENRN